MREIDQRICELLRVRKIEGMELLFKEYYKPLVVWGATFVSDVQRSEDIVQDFFVKLWEKSLTEHIFCLTTAPRLLPVSGLYPVQSPVS